LNFYSETPITAVTCAPTNVPAFLDGLQAVNVVGIMPGVSRQREVTVTARIGLTLDCADAVRVAEFWKFALGYEENPPPASFTSNQEWLASLGEPDTSPEDGAWLRDPAGIGPSLSILRVPEPKVAKNRLHIDIRVAADASPDKRWAAITAKAAELTKAGARTLRVHPDHHVTMADPEGNEFCVC
jgi:hypothetical protein